MISLTQIQADLVTAMKAKDQTAVEVLRGLKTRVQNEQVAKTAKSRPDTASDAGEGFLSEGKMALSEEEIVALIRSEVKRRKEAAESYAGGGREDLKTKELLEAEILQKYLPAQMSEAQISEFANAVILEHKFTQADFGKAMGALKAKAGSGADGALLAKVLKEKLTNNN